jgi:hypothetical protein
MIKRYSTRKHRFRDGGFEYQVIDNQTGRTVASFQEEDKAQRRAAKKNRQSSAASSVTSFDFSKLDSTAVDTESLTI